MWESQVWQVPLSTLATLVVAGATAYRLAEPSHSWADAFWMAVISCGYGRMGQEVAACTALATEHGFYGVTGDASLDDVLRRAGVNGTVVSVAVLGMDADNVYMVLSANALAPRIQVISRAESQEAASKLRRAGANDVVPYGDACGHQSLSCTGQEYGDRHCALAYR